MIDLCGLVEAKWANACVHEKEIDVSVGDQDVRRRCCFIIIICWFRKIARLTFNNGGGCDGIYFFVRCSLVTLPFTTQSAFLWKV